MLIRNGNSDSYSSWNSWNITMYIYLYMSTRGVPHTFLKFDPVKEMLSSGRDIPLFPTLSLSSIRIYT